MFPLRIKFFPAFHEVEIQRHLLEKDRHNSATLPAVPPPILSFSAYSDHIDVKSNRCPCTAISKTRDCASSGGGSFDVEYGAIPAVGDIARDHEYRRDMEQLRGSRSRHQVVGLLLPFAAHVVLQLFKPASNHGVSWIEFERLL